MPQLPDILRILEQFAYSTVLLSVALGLSTLILEDAATIAGAFLVANGLLSLSGALLILYSGIIIGDVALYAFGRYAARGNKAQLFLRKRGVIKAKSWMRERMFLAVFSARFIPGMRLTTYTACGFFRLSFWRFVTATALASCLWTTGLFFAASMLGEFVFTDMNEWRWGVSVLLIAMVIFLPRWLFKPKNNNDSNNDS